MEQSIAVELQGKTLKVTVSGVQVFSKADDDAKGLGADITKRADRGQINASLTAISVSLPYPCLPGSHACSCGICPSCYIGYADQAQGAHVASYHQARQDAVETRLGFLRTCCS